MVHRKEKNSLSFSAISLPGSLTRQQPGAMIIGHSPNAWCKKLRARMMLSDRHWWWHAQFGKAVSLTEGMVKSGTRPDQFTFTAIVAACQRANEAEVAFEVFRYDPCAALCCAVPCCAVLEQCCAALCAVLCLSKVL